MTHDEMRFLRREAISAMIRGYKSLDRIKEAVRLIELVLYGRQLQAYKDYQP